MEPPSHCDEYADDHDHCHHDSNDHFVRCMHTSFYGNITSLPSSFLPPESLNSKNLLSKLLFVSTRNQVIVLGSHPQVAAEKEKRASDRCSGIPTRRHWSSRLLLATVLFAVFASNTSAHAQINGILPKIPELTTDNGNKTNRRGKRRRIRKFC